MAKIVREYSEYAIPVYTDDEGNFWIQLHLPSIDSEIGDGTTIWQKVCLFNGDQIELLGTHLAERDLDVLTINSDTDSTLFEGQVFVGHSK